MTEAIKILEEQRRFFRQGGTKPIGARKKILQRLFEIYSASEKKITDALKKDLGKPEVEALGAEVWFCQRDVKSMIDYLEAWAKPQKAKTDLLNTPGKSYIMREPYGQALVISPWNYPFQLAIAPLNAAIGAGNTVILKPSELTPHTADLLVELINKNIPQEWAYVQTGDVKVASELLEQKFDKIFFTGSTTVGKIVAAAAAKNLTSVTLELGGKSPALVLYDCDVKVTARRIIWGKFLNAGQTCIAPDYVCVDELLKDKLLSEMKVALTELYGDKYEPGVNFSHIVNRRHFDRLKKLMASGTVFHGGKTDEQNLVIEPLILTNVSWQSPAMQEEIFGPILPVLTYKNLDEAIEKINSHDKPLALYLFTHDDGQKQKILNEISFGGGMVNDTLMHISNHHLPFGGVGASGVGCYHGEFGFLEFSHQKAILEKSFWPDIPLRYPPYTERKKNWLAKLF